MENEIKRRKSVVNIPIRDLHPHPKNPRKDLGDLEELTESIKKNGIMQNLTVIPGFYRNNGDWFKTDAEYTVIIGHRRLEAAKKAGLDEVPCRIYENLPETEQITTMLEENMQRNDLTPIEQADSFQYCLDLGETVDTISEKTGFAKSTIYHRLNIAKLNRDLIEEVEEDESFQITLKDYIALEKIKDIETRNHVLAQSKNSNDLLFKAEQAAKDEKRVALEADAEKLLKDKGLKEGETSDRWNGKYETIYRHSLAENEYTNDFIIPPEIEEKINEDTIYLISYGDVTLLNLKVKESSEAAGEGDDSDDSPSEWELQRRDREERKSKYEAIRKPMKHKTHDFVVSIITGKLDDIDKAEIADYSDSIFDLTLKYDIDTSFLNWQDMVEYITGTNKWDFETEDEFYEELHKLEVMPLHHKLLVAMATTMDAWDPIKYDGTYIYDTGKFLMTGYDILERWGWTYTDDEKLLLNGNHDLYREEDDEE